MISLLQKPTCTFLSDQQESKNQNLSLEKVTVWRCWEKNKSAWWRTETGGSDEIGHRGDNGCSSAIVAYDPLVCMSPSGHRNSPPRITDHEWVFKYIISVVCDFAGHFIQFFISGLQVVWQIYPRDHNVQMISGMYHLFPNTQNIFSDTWWILSVIDTRGAYPALQALHATLALTPGGLRDRDHIGQGVARRGTTRGVTAAYFVALDGPTMGGSGGKFVAVAIKSDTCAAYYTAGLCCVTLPNSSENLPVTVRVWRVRLSVRGLGGTNTIKVHSSSVQIHSHILVDSHIISA